MATVPTLDDRTAFAIREAISVARSGRLADACAIGERALDEGGDSVALNAMLGMLRCRSGNLIAGISHLRTASSERPDDLAITTNLVAALAEHGDHREALEVATRERAFADSSLRLARFRGFLAQTLEQYDVATEAYRHVVTADPQDFDSWNNLGNALSGLGETEQSIAALECAVRINPEAAPSRFNLALALRDAGRLDDAERQLRVIADAPTGDSRASVELHTLLKLQGREEEALAALTKALECDPDNIELMLNLARERMRLLQVDGAEQLYREVIARSADDSDAHVGLAIAYEHSNNSAALKALAGKAKANGVASGALNLIRAFGHRRAKRFTEGLAALDRVPADLEPARRAHLEGQCHEGLGHYDEAFAAFSRMNLIQAQDPSDPLSRGAQTRQRVSTETERSTREWHQNWLSAARSGERSPVFLVGFPRSGTTLLDTILMGHPAVEVMEERPALNRVEQELGGFDAVAGMDATAIEAARQRYFEEARKYAPLAPGKLLVDKSPLFLNKAALIHRLFPDARFILALRHPCDVVLSCFVSNFRLNSSMSNFLRLEDAAEFYDLTFRSWENALAVLPLQAQTVTYEKLVEDSEAELRPLTEWLGIEWRDEMLDHRRTAASRGLITTASYAQVTEAIYQRSKGRWRNYRTHLEPVLPILAPWVDKFGYTL